MDYEKEINNINNKLNNVEEVLTDITETNNKLVRLIEIMKTEINILKEGDNL